MVDRSKSPLWDPRSGIRFSPPPKPKSLYPVLDIARYIGTSGSSDSNLPKTKQTLPVSADDKAHLYGRTTNNVLRRTVSDSVISAPPSLSDAGIVAGTGEMAVDQPARTDSKGSTIESIVPDNALPYRMSAETLERAKKFPTGSPGSYWSHTMYQNLDDSDAQHHKVKVHYCTSKHTMEHVCKKYFVGEKVLGFDMEWSPWANRNSGPRQNVALIQIASPSRIGLFHCAVFPKDDFIGPTFQQIMGDANVSKVGVAIKADCTRLKKYMGVETRGILELSHLYKVIKYSRERRPDLVNKTLVTMSLLVEEILKLPIYKGDSVRTSDWTKPLKTQQISYSASDAYAGIQLYHTLEEQRRKLVPTPPRPHHAELGLPLEIAMADCEDEPAMETGWDDNKVLDAEPPSPKDNIAPQVSNPARDARVVSAELKLKQYRLVKRKGATATPAQLRAYFIWHMNEDLKPEAIAAMLRDPPLQKHTVTTYILKAVTNDSLPYDKSRMRNEILSLLHPSVQVGSMYQELIKCCMDTSSGT